MSGHNKWSKIKRKKAVTDAEKSRVFSKHSALIAMEARKAKGDLAAPGLINAIERAKKDSMPKDNIERAVTKGAGTNGDSFTEVIFETFGPGGTAMVITAITDNNNRTSNEVRNILSKAGYALGTPGSALWAFNKNQTGYSPNNPMDLTEKEGEALADLIEKLESQTDIQEIFTAADERLP
jgi:transcriptional/translational regulatory protein YebC/TACO1